MAFQTEFSLVINQEEKLIFLGMGTLRNDGPDYAPPLIHPPDYAPPLIHPVHDGYMASRDSRGLHNLERSQLFGRLMLAISLWRD